MDNRKMPTTPVRPKSSHEASAPGWKRLWPGVVYAFLIAILALAATSQGRADTAPARPPFGVAAAVIRHGGAPEFTSDGRTRVFVGNAVDENTAFQGASLGKVVTAYQALKMVGDGRLELDRPLHSYLDGKPWATPMNLGDQITLRHVLTHTSGLTNTVVPPNPAVVSEPGSRFSYSGNGFFLLQQAIEATTGKSIDQVMREEVFGPLGMTRTSFDPDVFLSDEAQPHVPAGPVILIAIVLICVVTLLLTGIVSVIRKIRKGSWRVSPRTFGGIALAAILLTSSAAGLILGSRFVIYVLVLQLVVALSIVGIHWLLRSLVRSLPTTGLSKWQGVVSVALTGVVVGLIFLVVRGQQLFVPPLGPKDGDANVAFSLRTTASDLAKFVTAVMNERELGLSGRNALFEPEYQVSESLSWSLGLATENTGSGAVFWQWGENLGFESIIAFVPQQGTAVVVLTNGMGGRDISRQIAKSELGISASLHVEALAVDR